jgi:hypothetical protein
MPAPERRRGNYTRDAAGLVAWAIDYFETTYDATMPRRTIGAYTKALKEMLDDGVEWRVLYEAVRMSIDHGRSVAALPQLIVPATKHVRDFAGLKPSSVQAARDLVAAKGWPTGARWRRSTAAGAFVHDPLGYDKPPSDFGVERPTLATIARAIEEGATA